MKLYSEILKSNINGWVETDIDTKQYRKEIVEDQIYLFREERNGEVFEKLMNYDTYGYDEILSACLSFGYTAKQVDAWMTEGEEVPLMLECLFELEK